MEADKEFSLDIDVDILPNSGREVVIGELFRLGWQRWIIIYPTPHADPRCKALHIHDESTKEASTEIIGATVTEQ